MTRNKQATNSTTVATILPGNHFLLDRIAVRWQLQGQMEAISSTTPSPERREAKGKPVASHGRAWQSILTPFTDQIWSWRGQEKLTLRQISALLAAQGVTVAPSTVLRFIEARKRRAAKLALPDLHPKTRQAPVQALAKGRVLIATATPATKTRPRTQDPQTTNSGLPLPDGQEVIGHDSAGRPMTRNKPFSGEI